ncbi:MAG: SdpI family protein [Planctomycetota bacterium]|nr:SdpI family protein [Planctomycetota bacterium]
MNAEQIIILVTCLVSSVVMIGCGVPLYCRKVGRNSWFGFRTKSSMSDDEIWYATNHVAGFWLMLTGACTALFAFAGTLAGLNVVESAVLMVGSMIAGISICMLSALGEQRRQLKERQRQADTDNRRPA